MMNIPFLSFDRMHQPLKAEMLEAFEKFYDAGWYVLGKNVELFENAYARFNNVKHCVGVSNGLDALHLCLKACDIKTGDEVIVPSNTFIATALAVSYTGATPVFVEPDIETYNIDVNRIEAAITSKTKAIIPVHLYGQACNMNEIMHLAKKYNLYVIEDNAQAQGARCGETLTGSFGNANATSFYPGKNLGALGDAGAITTSDDGIAAKIKMLRNYGSRVKYYNEDIGFNMRLDECQAAFLNIKLKHLERWTNERIQIAGWYREALNTIENLVLPASIQPNAHVYHLYVVRTKKRDELQHFLQQHGVGTLIHYPVPPHLQTAYKFLNHKRGDFPIAEEIADTCLSLPLFVGMTQNEVAKVADVISNFFTSK